MAQPSARREPTLRSRAYYPNQKPIQERAIPISPVYLLAIATLVLVVAFLVWNLISVRRNQKTGGKTSGLGGPNDPMA